MVRPEIWGPPIWTFFHVLAEKIKETEFTRVNNQLFSLIKRICSYLPCPECSKHAGEFLRKINMIQINTKDKFRGMLYVFHNVVNLRKRKNPFNFEHLVNYRNIKLIHAFNNFVHVYNTKGNMNMLTESFQRSLLLKDLRKWLMVNYFAFDDTNNINQLVKISNKEIEPTINHVEIEDNIKKFSTSNEIIEETIEEQNEVSHIINELIMDNNLDISQSKINSSKKRRRNKKT